MTEKIDYKAAEKQLRDLAATGLSPVATWATGEIDRLRAATQPAPPAAMYAVWLPEGKVACFDAATYDYRADQGELFIYAARTEMDQVEVARFALGQWCGVVRTDTLSHGELA